MLEAFHFIRPLWLIAVIPAAALAWYWLRRTQTGSGWESAIDSDLLNVLLDATQSKSGKWFSGLLISALLLAPVGLAGPTWEKLPQNVEQRQDTLIILLDLSLSMLAQDVKPSRVARARQEIVDMLRLREEGQTALIAYAGDAHAVVPLTDDVATIENLLVSLSPEMMPVFGSNPDHALTLAHELFENAKVLQGRIVMITDGVDLLGDVSRHRNAAYPISVLGIGTASGASVPLDRLRQPGRTLRTQEGNQIIAQLDDVRLREVANLGYGRYEQARVGDADIITLLSTPLPTDDETIEVEREFDTWADQGHWIALLLLPLALLAFRKGVFIVLILGVALPAFMPTRYTYAAPPVEFKPEQVDSFWDSLWQRKDQRAWQKLREGHPEFAAALFDDPQWRAVAQYRSSDFTGALSGFGQDESLTGWYNQGNSLARLQQYEAAIAAYDQVLAQDPEHEDALFNKRLVERLLEEQQASEQSEDDQGQSNDQEQSEEEQQDQDEQQQEQESNEEQQESEQQQEEEGEEQEEAEAEETESRDEKQEALEQWLRRVPDDPGGLLRRKFSHETKQRLRQGDYEHTQGDKIW